DALGAVAGTHQALALRRFLGLSFLLLLVLQAGRQHLHGFFPIAVLRAVVLTLHHEASWQVSDAHGRIGLVHVLPARATRSDRIDAQFGRINSDLGLSVRFWKHGHSASRSVDAALCLGLGHTLHAVRPGLELELAIYARAIQARNDFLIAAD